MSNDTVSFDFAAWDSDLKLDPHAAARLMGVSKGFYLKMRREGAGRKVYAWAAEGIRARMMQHDA